MEPSNTSGVLTGIAKVPKLETLGNPSSGLARVLFFTFTPKRDRRTDRGRKTEAVRGRDTDRETDRRTKKDRERGREGETGHRQTEIQTDKDRQR